MKEIECYLEWLKGAYMLYLTEPHPRMIHGKGYQDKFNRNKRITKFCQKFRAEINRIEHEIQLQKRFIPETISDVC